MFSVFSNSNPSNRLAPAAAELSYEIQAWNAACVSWYYAKIDKTFASSIKLDYWLTLTRESGIDWVEIDWLTSYEAVESECVAEQSRSTFCITLEFRVLSWAGFWMNNYREETRHWGDLTKEHDDNMKLRNCLLMKMSRLNATQCARRVESHQRIMKWMTCSSTCGTHCRRAQALSTFGLTNTQLFLKKKKLTWF